jgi:hypothetical protein
MRQRAWRSKVLMHLLDYLTDQSNKATSSAVATAAKLGADPNTLSSLLNQNFNNILKIGAENHDRNMQNFSNYLSSVDMISKNKEAEWASRQDIIKNKMASAQSTRDAGMANIGSAANALISLEAAGKTRSLFTEKQ